MTTKRKRGPVIRTDWVVESLDDHMEWVITRIYDYKPDQFKQGKYWPQPFRIVKRIWKYETE